MNGHSAGASTIPVPEELLSWLISAAGILLCLEALPTARVVAFSETCPEEADRISRRLQEPPA